MIRVTSAISLEEGEIDEQFIRASGPGGQNVNKVSSAVQLRFDALHSPSLTGEVKSRLMRLAGKRMTKEGVIVITAQNHRSQDQNRREALDRLLGLIRQAAVRPTVRRATKPTKAARKKRLDTKKHRGGIKKMRQSRPSLD